MVHTSLVTSPLVVKMTPTPPGRFLVPATAVGVWEAPLLKIPIPDKAEPFKNVTLGAMRIFTPHGNIILAEVLLKAKP